MALASFIQRAVAATDDVTRSDCVRRSRRSYRRTAVLYRLTSGSYAVPASERTREDGGVAAGCRDCGLVPACLSVAVPPPCQPARSMMSSDDSCCSPEMTRDDPSDVRCQVTVCCAAAPSDVSSGSATDAGCQGDTRARGGTASAERQRRGGAGPDYGVTGASLSGQQCSRSTLSAEKQASAQHTLVG